jgi:three-Cys-motif partner protein
MLDADGRLLDEVGPWAKDKHERLRKYIDISRAARRKFVVGPGGATYIDLFCGAGRAFVRDLNETIDGSPLVAFKSARDGGVPFSEIHIADLDEQRCAAAAARIADAGGAATQYSGSAADTVAEIAARLNPYGLHFAFLDPFNLDALPFKVIETLSRLRRIDMLIHVSAQDLQRNLDMYSISSDGPLDHFAPGWRNVVDLGQARASTRAAYISYWTSKMEELGLPPARRAELVSGTKKNQRLYWLVFVSRSEFAKSLWDKIRNISGQGELPI